MKDITDFPITSDWQEIDNFHSTPHSGIDLATPLHSKIFSKDEGYITLTTDKFLGNAIRLKLNNGDIIVYGHIAEFKVKDKQYVNKNTLLGLTGGDPNMENQGHTSGCHVHVSQYHEGQLISPYNYLFKHDEYYSNFNSNPFIFPVMIILILIIIWKFKKYVLYGFLIATGLIILFIVS